MNYDLWAPKRRIETQYLNSLTALNKNIWERIKNLLDPFEILTALQKITLTMEFKQYAEAQAAKMVTSLFTDAGRTWRTAAKVNSRGREIYEALKNELRGPVGDKVFEQILRNSELIKTLPHDLAEYVNQHIYRETVKGRRSEDIAKEIKAWFSEGSRAKAELIARTEVSKTSTALNRARCENLGLDWYVWRTEKDSRVRDSHRLMEGVLVAWNNPPSPEELNGEKSYGHYHSGEIFNCRCFPEPLTNLNLIQWPHKVYYGGQIQMMTRSKFERLVT